MKQDDSNILKNFGKDPGFKVPENFFADFNKNLADSLPEIKIAEAEQTPSRWVRFRPYIYMAAMFAGIWCMMKIFNDFSGVSNHQKTATELAEGLRSDEQNAEDFIMNGDVSDYDIMNYEDSVFADTASADTAKPSEVGK